MWWNIDTENLQERVTRRITRGEFLAFFLAFEVVLYLAFSGFLDPIISGEEINDFQIYLRALTDSNQGEWEFFYPYYLLFIFEILELVSFQVAFVIWNGINIIALIIAARIFGGNPVMTVINFLTFILIVEGQVTGLVVMGMAVMWYGVQRKNPFWMGFGAIFLVIKYHFGAFVALFLWLHPKIDWEIRLKALIIPAIALVLSFVAYGLWPLEIIDRITGEGPRDINSISLWRYIGPLSLLVWIPVFVLKLPPERRLQLVAVTVLLAPPYMQYYDLQMIFPWTNWFAATGNLLFVYILLDIPLSALILIPLTLYILMVGSEIRKLLQAETTT